MIKKENLEQAKIRLFWMEKLYKFHETVMAMPLPHFEIKSSIEEYAKEYRDLVFDCFGYEDLYLEGLKKAGLTKVMGYEDYNFLTVSPFRFPEVEVGYADSLYIDKIQVAETPEVEKKRTNRAKEQLSLILEPIEKALAYYPKPRANAWQRAFGRTKYFKMKQTVLSKSQIDAQKRRGA